MARNSNLFESALAAIKNGDAAQLQQATEQPLFERRRGENTLSCVYAIFNSDSSVQVKLSMLKTVLQSQDPRCRRRLSYSRISLRNGRLIRALTRAFSTNRASHEEFLACVTVLTEAGIIRTARTRSDTEQNFLTEYLTSGDVKIGSRIRSLVSLGYGVVNNKLFMDSVIRTCSQMKGYMGNIGTWKCAIENLVDLLHMYEEAGNDISHLGHLLRAMRDRGCASSTVRIFSNRFHVACSLVYYVLFPGSGETFQLVLSGIVYRSLFHLLMVLRSPKLILHCMRNTSDRNGIGFISEDNTKEMLLPPHDTSVVSTILGYLKARALPWHPTRTYLYPRIVRQEILTILLLQRKTKPKLPTEIWLEIISFLCDSCEVHKS